jgi:beta-N-acetylhexosaminidase
VSDERGRHAAEERFRRWPWIVGLGVVAVLVLAGAVYVFRPSSSPSSSGSSADGAPASHRPPVTVSVGPGGDCVSATVAALGLEGQVGQLLMVGTQVTDPTSAQSTVKKYRLGGVFLTSRFHGSAADLRNDLAQLQAAAKVSSGVPLQIGADQEGGQVQTLQGDDFPPIPSAVTQGGLDSATLASRTKEWAGRVKNVGVTIDLAPVADVVPAGLGKANPPIGAFNRQYGSTPGPVAADVATVVTAAQATGLQTTLKHFPGLGRVRSNTDTSRDARDDQTTSTDPSLEPFAKGIAAGTTAVMISSALYPRLDPDAIAAFSQPIVTGLLRQKMGFGGLVMSDDLGAAKAADAYPIGDRAVRFIRAGGDLVLTVRTSDAGPMTEALLKAARSDQAFAARVKESAGRVLQSKAKAGLLSCS